MCLSSPSAPPPPPPPEKPAEVKQAETIDAVRVKRKDQAAAGGMGSGTLLTGPGGIQTGALNVTKPTLLGQ
jgi:hypothetical protein